MKKLLLVLALLFCCYTAQAATFGNTEEGGNSVTLGEGQIYGRTYQLARAGKVTSLSIWDAELGVWNTTSLATPLALSAGYYFIAVQWKTATIITVSIYNSANGVEPEGQSLLASVDIDAPSGALVYQSCVANDNNSWQNGSEGTQPPSAIFPSNNFIWSFIGCPNRNPRVYATYTPTFLRGEEAFYD